MGLYLERLYISPQLVEFLLIPHSGSGTYLEERVLQPSIEKTAVHLVLRKQLWVLKKKRLELEQFRIQIVHLAFRVDRELQRFKLAGELASFGPLHRLC